jgi:hypothetical protein
MKGRNNPMYPAYNPCSRGHVWIWVSSTTYVQKEPPGYCLCLCGRYTWNDYAGTNNQRPALTQEEIDAGMAKNGEDGLWKARPDSKTLVG